MTQLLGIRIHGIVTHILRNGETSQCGRIVQPITDGKTTRRLCKTCVRLYGPHATTLPTAPLTEPQHASPALIECVGVMQAPRNHNGEIEHYHAPGCSDIAKEMKRFGQKAGNETRISVSSRAELYAFVWGDIASDEYESGSNEWLKCVNENGETSIRVMPCLNLPSGIQEAKARKAQRNASIEASMDLSTLKPIENAWEWKLTSEELNATLEKVNKINARCAKKGIPGGLTVEWDYETITEMSPAGIPIEYIVYRTKITGIAPVIPGWEFIATIDHDPYAGLIVRTYPGGLSVDRSELREGWCDHCQVTRMRNQTYVMRNTQTGEQVQVGSSCIKDFTGWNCLPYSFDKDAKAFEESFGHGHYAVSVLTALAVAWACVTHYGYVKTSEMNCTRDRVFNVIWPPAQMKPQEKAELEFIKGYADSMMEKAAELRAWILSEDFSGYGEYVLNLKAVAQATQVTSRNLGLLCSAPQAWARFLEKTFVQKVEKSVSTSEYIGEIGERWEIPLTVESERFIESNYGCTTLYRMLDAKGNVFKWFASNGNLTVGTTVTLAAGIKKHSVWNNVAETTLTRCKVVADIPEARKVKDAPVDAGYEKYAQDLSINLNDIYMVDGHYYRVRTTKGIAYAQRHTEDGWAYAMGSIKDLTTFDVITAEQAAQFGHMYGSCVFCHKALSDERSTSVGYGQDCANNHGLPWG